MSRIGTCPLCPSGTRPQLLYGMGHCFNHFRNPSVKEERTPKPTVQDKNKDEAKKLDKWFNEQKQHIPKNCENCDKPIGKFKAPLTWKIAVAHILPKKTFKSIMTHPLNRFFACWDCHGLFDTLTNDERKRLPVARICRERYQQFKDSIAPKEQSKVPEWIKESVQ